jgi:hypothetical protein
MRLWQEVDDRTVRFQLERFSAAVDPLNPTGGLQDVTIDGQELVGFHPLAPELPPISTAGAASSLERYVRGGDLVATYSDRPAPQMRTQIYWRSATHDRLGAIAAVELVASVQTSLLDACPQFAARSQLLAGEAYRLTVGDPVTGEPGSFVSIVPPSGDADPDAQPEAPHCYLFRLPGRQYSYAEMIHPADCQSSQWDGWLHGTEFRLQLRHELFGDRLEKGVILRARVLGVLLDRRDDKAAAARHWQAFLSEGLPLTT